jgi:ribosomal protein L16 Arg81 hydroxylase
MSTEQQVNQAREKVRATVTAKVNELTNLTDAQRQVVLDICLAHAVNHSGVEPHYDNVADHVRRTVKS